MSFGHHFKKAAKIAGGIAAIITLTACIDVDVSLEVLDNETALGTVTMTMARDFYDASQSQGTAAFCSADDEFTVGETVVTCVSTQEGVFADVLDADDGEPAPTIVDLGNGTVRVALPTKDIMDDMSSDRPDAAAMAALQGMFLDKHFTLEVSGKQIIDTNMELSEDGKSASVSIPIIDLVAGTAQGPDESYAIVKWE